MIEIRRVGADEWALWRDVRVAALTLSPGAFSARIEDWERGGEATWRERLTLPGACNLVALRDGDAVGVVRGVPAGESGEGGVVDVHSVWVHPDTRGAGVGGRLLARVEAWARDAGAGMLRLKVLADNDGAIGLYRRHGFVDSGQVEGREIVMVKELRPRVPDGS